jgi:UDP:flavonoid glycosyltransferase YjiC (YdhE family)
VRSVRILATFVGGWGHAEPLLTVAQIAAGRGHAVTFVGQAAVVPRLADLGFDTVAVGPATVGQTARPLVAVDRDHERRVIRDHFAGTIADFRARGFAELFERRRPDVVVCDEADFGAMIAAERLGIPRASVCVIAAGTLAGHDVLAEPLALLRRQHGLPPDPDMAMLGGDLLLVPVPLRFRDPGVPLPRTAHLVRPPILEQMAGAARRDRRSPDQPPLVYITLGTIFNVESGDLFARLIEAVRDLDAEVVVSVGPYLSPDELGPLPDHVRVEQFVEQADVLPSCGAVVCHGGSGTTISSLALGVPLVVLPIGADQPDNAERCTALGMGVTLDAVDARPPDIAVAISTLLGDPGYAERAGQLAFECEALPPTDHAVDLIEALAATRPSTGRRI